MAFHANTRLRGGWIGVDIFFVLSGFLITTLLLQEYDRFGSIALSAFYGRRARRLLPALVVTIGLVGLIYLLRPSISEGAGFGWTAIAALLYAANFSHIDLGLFTPTWSPSLEEQFYILWPPLLLLCLRGRWSSRRIVGLVLLLAILISATRAELWLSIHDGFSLNWRADGLLLGCALAMARRAPDMRRLVDRLCGPEPPCRSARPRCSCSLPLPLLR